MRSTAAPPQTTDVCETVAVPATGAAALKTGAGGQSTRASVLWRAASMAAGLPRFSRRGRTPGQALMKLFSPDPGQRTSRNDVRQYPARDPLGAHQKSRPPRLEAGRLISCAFTGRKNRAAVLQPPKASRPDRRAASSPEGKDGLNGHVSISPRALVRPCARTCTCRPFSYGGKRTPAAADLLFLKSRRAGSPAFWRLRPSPSTARVPADGRTTFQKSWQIHRFA